MSIDNRLSKLEAIRGAGPVLIWCRPGETEQQTRVRWNLENPGRDATLAYVIGWAYTSREGPNGWPRDAGL